MDKISKKTDIYSTFFNIFVGEKKYFMPEIRLNINNAFFESLQEDTGIQKPSQLTNEALNLLKWVASETKKGRVLITTNSEGGDIQKIIIPSLQNMSTKD